MLPPERAEERPLGAAGDTLAQEAKRPRLADVSAGEKLAKKQAEGWACPACTLLNSADTIFCLACEGVRWVLPDGAVPPEAKRQVSAMVLRAARRGAPEAHEAAPAAPQRVRTVDEWAALPPAPDGHLQRTSAKDDDVDIFGMAQEEADEASDGEGGGERALEGGACTALEAGSPLEAGAAAQHPRREGTQRPRWGIGEGPLFAGTQASGGGVCGLDEATLFELAVDRLVMLGFDRTKCHLALEAAGRDEGLAQEFLVREA